MPMNLQQHINDVETLPDGRVALNPQLWDLIPREPFDRTYLDKFNALNCKPDIEDVVHFSAKQVCNIMAVWQCYKRHFGVFKAHVTDRGFVAYAPNNRMATFLRHMTKWTVLGNEVTFLPSTHFTYFGINPDSRELKDLEGVHCPTEAIIVGGASAVNWVAQSSTWLGTLNQYVDNKILGPNKIVSHT